MRKQVFDPYLPLSTYIPDGEPHVFGDRVYVYGSHDAEGGDCFCLLDYECWSAPVTDLMDRRCEGTIYRAEQCRHYIQAAAGYVRAGCGPGERWPLLSVLRPFRPEGPWLRRPHQRGDM